MPSKGQKNHLLRFNRLYEEIKNGDINGDWLLKLEIMDNIFPDFDYQVYR